MQGGVVYAEHLYNYQLLLHFIQVEFFFLGVGLILIFTEL